MTPQNLHDIESDSHLKGLLPNDNNQVCLLNFWAQLDSTPWAQSNEIVLELAKKYPKLLVLQVEVKGDEEVDDEGEIDIMGYKFGNVPTYMILRGGTVIDQFVGTPDRTFVKALEKHLLGHAYVPLSKTDQPPARVSSTVDVVPHDIEKQETEEELKARMHALMNQGKIMLFMKGSPKKPYCQFSRKMVTLLKDNGISEYSYFDILKDQSVREGMKKVNEWQTFPQLFVNGQFVGGTDIVEALILNGEFNEHIASLMGQ